MKDFYFPHTDTKLKSTQNTSQTLANFSKLKHENTEKGQQEASKGHKIKTQNIALLNYFYFLTTQIFSDSFSRVINTASQNINSSFFTYEKEK